MSHMGSRLMATSKKAMREVRAILLAEHPPKKSVRGAKSAPAARSVRARGSQPKISTTRHLSTRIKHEEMFSSVTATDDNVLERYSITPSSAALFPWLSHLARLYEKYIVHSMTFKFTSRMSTDKSGSLILSLDPDPDDPDIGSSDPQTDRKLLTYTTSSNSSVWRDSSIRVPTDGTKRYVRGAQHEYASESFRLTDLGKFYVFTDHTTDPDRVIGLLSVQYDIELFQPTFPEENSNWGSDTDSGLTLSPTIFIGNPSTEGELITPVTNTQRTFKFSSIGKYLLEIFFEGTSFSGSFPSITFPGGSGSIDLLERTKNGSDSEWLSTYTLDITVPDTLMVLGALTASTLARFHMRAGAYGGDN